MIVAIRQVVRYWARWLLLCAPGAGCRAAQAQDFFSALFGGLAAASRAPLSMPHAVRQPDARRIRRRCAGRRSRPRLSAAARPIACAPATDAISRSSASDNASRAAVLQQFLPGQRDQAGLWQQHRQCRDRDRQTLFRAAERVPLSQRDRGGLHLQRQGPDRSRAGQDRERSDACARATSSPRPAVCWSPAAGATSAAPR